MIYPRGYMKYSIVVMQYMQCRIQWGAQGRTPTPSPLMKKGKRKRREWEKKNREEPVTFENFSM